MCVSCCANPLLVCVSHFVDVDGKIVYCTTIPTFVNMIRRLQRKHGQYRVHKRHWVVEFSAVQIRSERWELDTECFRIKRLMLDIPESP